MSTGLAAAPLMTAEQLFELPDDGLRHELVEGVLVTMSPPGGLHGRISLRVGARLDAFVEARPEPGAVFGNDTGVLLRRNPDTVRAPDVAVVLGPASLAAARDPGYLQVVPDLVVEVVSPSDRASDVTAKALTWVRAGVRLVWVVDPGARAATAYGPDGVHVVDEHGALDGGDVLPGFSLPLAELLA